MYMPKKTVSDINVSGKRVLMRVDFNVPIKDGVIRDDRRIVEALPTIRQVVAGGGRLVLMSHLGRPDGAYDPAGSLAPCAIRLGELLRAPVRLGPKDVIGPETETLVNALKDGEVVLLENVRFHPGETMPDKAKKNPDGKLTPQQETLHRELVDGLASLGDLYVNDAFGTCHRKHASMYGAARAIQAKGGSAVAGHLLEKEIRYLHEAVTQPKRPFVAILGGAKVSDKIKLISSLLKKVDRILIGGAMAYTLLKARGVPVGISRVEEDQVEAMKAILDQAQGKILLPVDHVGTRDFEAGAPQVISGEAIPDDLMGMDIGAATRAAYCDVVARAGTVVWNGPMGVFEKPEYSAGTQAVAGAMAQATAAGAVTIIGGGDSAAAVGAMGLAERMTHVSTGGGASLTYLEGKVMPPIETLDEK
jgi:phosphoglycerate kinase